MNFTRQNDGLNHIYIPGVYGSIVGHSVCYYVDVYSFIQSLHAYLIIRNHS